VITKSWQLQDAKNRFSEVVELALKEGVQTVTKHGKPAVVIISAADYEKTVAPRKSLLELLQECPEDLTGIVSPRNKQLARSHSLKS
jgi:prevent-host-death family protein